MARTDAGLTLDVQVRDARHLSARVADDALVDAGVSGPHVEHHEGEVPVTGVVGDAVLVAQLQRMIVVEPLALWRNRRVDLAPEVSHGAVVQMLVSHRFEQTGRCDAGCLNVD